MIAFYIVIYIYGYILKYLRINLNNVCSDFNVTEDRDEIRLAGYIVITELLKMEMRGFIILFSILRCMFAMFCNNKFGV